MPFWTEQKNYHISLIAVILFFCTFLHRNPAIWSIGMTFWDSEFYSFIFWVWLFLLYFLPLPFRTLESTCSKLCLHGFSICFQDICACFKITSSSLSALPPSLWIAFTLITCFSTLLPHNTHEVPSLILWRPCQEKLSWLEEFQKTPIPILVFYWVIFWLPKILWSYDASDKKITYSFF